MQKVLLQSCLLIDLLSTEVCLYVLLFSFDINICLNVNIEQLPKVHVVILVLCSLVDPYVQAVRPSRRIGVGYYSSQFI